MNEQDTTQSAETADETDLVRAIAQCLDAFPDVVFCVLYGSYARGQSHAGSDLDVGIASTRPLPPERCRQIGTALTLALDKEVDLIDLQRHSGLILKEALCKGIVVQNKRPAVYANMMIRMLFNQSDMMPLHDRILKERRKAFVHG